MDVSIMYNADKITQDNFWEIIEMIIHDRTFNRDRDPTHGRYIDLTLIKLGFYETRHLTTIDRVWQKNVQC